MDTSSVYPGSAQQYQASEADHGFANLLPAGDSRYRQLMKLPRSYKQRVLHEMSIATDEKRKEFLLKEAEKKMQSISSRNKANSNRHKKGTASHKQRPGCGKAGYIVDQDVDEDIADYDEGRRSDWRGTTVFSGCEPVESTNVDTQEQPSGEMQTYRFHFFVEGGWINCGSAEWTAPWINPLACFGQEVAERLPALAPEEWHTPSYDWYCNGGDRDPVLAALEDGQVDLFKQPCDLLRWEIDGVDGIHRSALHIAFAHHHIEALEYLVTNFPVPFLQQIVMSSGSGGYREVTPLLVAMLQGNLQLIKWMCETGIMTETVFDNCDPRAETDKSALQAAMSMSLMDVVEELERWKSLPDDVKYDLTQKRFPDLVHPRQSLVVTLRITIADTNGNIELECYKASGEVEFRLKGNVNDPYERMWNGVSQKTGCGIIQRLQLVLEDRLLPSPRNCVAQTVGDVLKIY